MKVTLTLGLVCLWAVAVFATENNDDVSKRHKELSNRRHHHQERHGHQRSHNSVSKEHAAERYGHHSPHVEHANRHKGSKRAEQNVTATPLEISTTSSTKIAETTEKLITEPPTTVDYSETNSDNNNLLDGDDEDPLSGLPTIPFLPPGINQILQGAVGNIGNGGDCVRRLLSNLTRTFVDNIRESPFVRREFRLTINDRLVLENSFALFETPCPQSKNPFPPLPSFPALGIVNDFGRGFGCIIDVLRNVTTAFVDNLRKGPTASRRIVLYINGEVVYDVTLNPQLQLCTQHRRVTHRGNFNGKSSKRQRGGAANDDERNSFENFLRRNEESTRRNSIR